MAQLDRRWQAITVEERGDPAMMLSACRYPLCGVRIEL
jgi:hypothetical protein